MSPIPTLTRIINPQIEPLTLEEVKEHLKINITDDDRLLCSLITAVRCVAEEFMQRSLISQSWKLSYDKYAPTSILLPMGPVQEINSVTAISRNAVRNVLPANNYYLENGNRRLVFDATPIGHFIEIIYIAGYGANASDVPCPIRCGMITHLTAIYDGRIKENILPKPAAEFYLMYRRVRV